MLTLIIALFFFLYIKMIVQIIMKTGFPPIFRNSLEMHMLFCFMPSMVGWTD